MPRIVGLDTGLTTGWASGEPGAQPAFGQFKLRPCKGDYGALLSQYGSYLRPLLSPGCYVGYESPILHPRNSLHTTMVLCGLAAETERLCHEIGGITYASFSPVTVKKTFAGDHHASKDKMIAMARLLGILVEEEHEADGVGVWHCMLRVYDRAERTSFFTEHLSPLFERGIKP